MRTQDKTKHSPLPWKAAQYSSGLNIEAGNGQTICFFTIDRHDPAEVARSNVDLFLRAVNSHSQLVEALKRSAKEHDDMAALLDAWARESVDGGWSTHQVDANRKRADQCRRLSADARAALKAAEELSPPPCPRVQRSGMRGLKPMIGATKRGLKFGLGDIVQLNSSWNNRVGLVRADHRAWWVIRNYWDIANCICETNDVVKVISRRAVPKKFLRYCV